MVSEMRINFQLRVMAFLSIIVLLLIVVGLFGTWKFSHQYVEKHEILDQIYENIQQILSAEFVETRYRDMTSKQFNNQAEILKSKMHKFVVTDQVNQVYVDIMLKRIDRIEGLYQNIMALYQLEPAPAQEAMSHLEDKLFSEMMVMQEDTLSLRDANNDSQKKQLSEGISFLFVAIFIISLFPVWVNLSISRRLSVRLGQLTSVTQRIRNGDFSARVGLSSGDELGRISQAMDNMLDSIEKLTVTRKELEDIVRSRTCELEVQAMKDCLTNVYNRRVLMERVATEIARSRRHGHPLSLIFFDLDYFKQINDRYGHVIGDKTLIEACRILSRELRESDMLARYGGDEFAILCVDSDAQDAAQLGERLRSVVEEFYVEHHILTDGLTISVGVAELSMSDDLTTFFKRVDDALYSAKEKGRNNVQVDMLELE
jgi:diguanylate cyclase (GGDEF)-like protein